MLADTTVLDPLNGSCNSPDPAKASLKVEICPKKYNVAMLVVISLGYDSKFGDDDLDTRRSRNAHGQLSRNLTVRYSWSEDETDRKLFR